MGKRDRTTTVPPNPIPQNSSEIILKDDGKAYTAVTEGLATVLFPKVTTKKDKSGKVVEVQGDVFYNPIQQFNRDLSVLAIKAFGEIYLEEKRLKKEGKKENKAKGKGNDKLEDAQEPRITSEALDIESKSEALVEAQEPPAIKPEGGPSTTPMDISTDAISYTPRPLTPPKFTILDALSATGLRALRYALEIPFLTSVTANDLDPSATTSIARNITYNKTTADVPPEIAMAKVRVSLANASHHMYSVLSPPPPATEPHTPTHLLGAIGKYDVIDLDPFGTAAPFLDAAVQAISDGGLLAITCTDAGVWASTGYSEKCFSLYGGTPVKGEWSHEGGIRLILNAVAMAAGRYGCWMEPLLSLSVDFYARVFVRIRRGPEKVKRLASGTMVVYNCDEGCGAWVTQRLGKCKEERDKKGGTYAKFGLARAPTTDANCKECGFPMHLAGPMYAGPLHSPVFITHLLDTLPPATNPVYATVPRITGMLQTALQESSVSAPFFFATTRLAKTLHCESPPLAAFRGALKGLGYGVARSHCKPTSIKTDAPWGVVWEVMRRWVEEKPIKTAGMGEKMAGYKILRLDREKGEDGKVVGLTKEEQELRKLEVVFDEKLGKDEDKGAGVVRYQVNPTANWGPMARGKVVVAGKRGSEEDEVEGERAGKKQK